MPVLFAFREDRFGFRFEIGEGAVLGRSPECDLILFDRATSRVHAEIRKTGDGYVLIDMGSTNGTMYNDVRLEGQVPLQKNDEIRVGQEVFLFDPDLDVAVGREGAVLIAGDVDDAPEGMYIGASDIDVQSLDRGCLLPLYQVATALAGRPRKARVLKQSAYALTKIFGASSIALLWPESSDSGRLTALLSRPENRRLVLPRPMADLVLREKRAVIWPVALKSLQFSKGERYLEEAPHSAMCVPLPANDDLTGLLYVESSQRVFTQRDLNFLNALGSLIGPALTNAALISELDYRLAQEEEELSRGGSFIGEDHQIKALLGTAYQVGLTDARIILTGEVGTGKEVLARKIHSQSPRRRGPFISVNCAAFAPGQIETTLFGEEAGALSEEGTPGMLEKADGGTLFLRHVDHLPLSAQGELLRAMEEGLVYRIGSNRPRPSSFRTISSTTADLYQLVEAGSFREDLQQRLAEVTLEMPPLRDIRGDINTLSKFFLDRSAKDRGMAAPDFDPAVAECLQAYPWPGNAGELKNAAERLAMFTRDNRLVLDDLPPELRLAPATFKTMDEDYESDELKEVQKIYIRRALARSGGDTEMAAGILGINRMVLEQMVKRYNIWVD